MSYIASLCPWPIHAWAPACVDCLNEAMREGTRARSLGRSDRRLMPRSDLRIGLLVPRQGTDMAKIGCFFRRMTNQPFRKMQKNPKFIF